MGKKVEYLIMNHPVFHLGNGETLSAETVWTSCHGVKEKFIDMDGMHLVNLYNYLQERSKLIPAFRMYDLMVSTIVLSIINSKNDAERGLLLELVRRGRQIAHEWKGKYYIFTLDKGLKECSIGEGQI
jgi:hypothetical protein